ncbi:MAG: thioredoxin domain-containing protein [Gaiellaceae bacterium]
MTQRSKNRLLVGVFLVAAGLAAVLIAVSVTGAKDEPPPAAHGSLETEALFEGVRQRGNVLGRPGAPVTIVEYADLQCPYCAQWARDTLPAIVDEYVRAGKVRIVFEGVAILGPESASALQTVVSAGAQNKLWNMSELVFHNQGTENSGWVTDDLLRRSGNSVPGLDVDAMMDDRSSQEVAAAVADAQAAAQAAGVNVTPSFQIGKTGGEMTLVVGAQPTADFRQILDSLLEP